MRKLLFIALAIATLATTTIVTLASNSVALNSKPAPRMPACYYYECLDAGGGCNGLGGWASSVGYGMAMYGYTGIHYDERCCDDACFHICASMCGNPPGNQPIVENNMVEKTLTFNGKNLSRDKAIELGTQQRAKILSDGGQVTNLSVIGETVTVTYTVAK